MLASRFQDGGEPGVGGRATKSAFQSRGIAHGRHREDISLDALLIINYLNNFGSMPVTLSPPGSVIYGPNYLDVSGDNYISPIDALLIFNFLNNPPGGPEGEGVNVDLVAEAAPVADVATDSFFSDLAVAQQPQSQPEHQSLADYIAGMADEEELARRRRGTN